MTESTPTTPLTRRRLLVLGGSFAGGAAILAACGGDDAATASTTAAGSAATTSTADTADATVAPATDGSTTTSASTATATEATTGTPADTVFTAADFAGLGSCVLLPELTEGPFPTIDQRERRDITEGRAGLPLRVGVQVVDEACTPIAGARVEIWHCDIDGDYSAYADGYTDDDDGEGTTFLRGAQVANADGIVEFHTVYPGWYRGRAVHIHAKVHLDDATVLTTQFLFDDAVNAEVMASDPYAAFGEPDTTNDEDGTTGGSAAADGLLLMVSDDADIGGRRGLIVVGLDPTATSSGGGGGPGGGGRPPGGGPGGDRPTP